ncbi:hypothetical protein SAMN04488564_104181 [Lentzea waywayandensis]|uniref:Uncharacterized protein n=1 Tax=Lentzea waywayandensis TaxID=84724 RepID=A0A1I6ECS1_9PSEU|nr:hypothetical protein [Lentzea waywayandensis]SFR15540.1 hypothetical protein SAMN04488564_104181 [Lentzea waywayandensis]
MINATKSMRSIRRRERWLDLLNAALVRDYLVSRPPVDADAFVRMPDVASHINSLHTGIVYTGFDGDHFGLTSLMRQYVLKGHRVPANPESIIGYKDSVDAHGSKLDVLLDDLAVLGRCDELWIFTDVAPTARDAAANLAEGALLELAYFLYICEAENRSTAPVRFVSIASLQGVASAASHVFRGTFAELIGNLTSDQQRILEILEDLRCGLLALPKIAYILHDPLDAKYMDWLRPTAYKGHRVPLVPQLAVEYGDIRSAVVDRRVDGPLACPITSWALLTRLADELWLLPSVSVDRPDSYTCEIVKLVWQSQGRSADGLIKREWSDFGIPKVVHEDKWPLTEREGRR